MPGFSPVFPIFSPLPPLHLEFFQCLKHRNEFVQKTVMNYGIDPFCSNVILMRFVSSSFWPWSRAFVGINNTSVFLSYVSQYCGGFPHCSLSVFCKCRRVEDVQGVLTLFCSGAAQVVCHALRVGELREQLEVEEEDGDRQEEEEKVENGEVESRRVRPCG